MKGFVRASFLVACLLPIQTMAFREQEEAMHVSNASEFCDFFKNFEQAVLKFEKKHTNLPSLKCTTCKDEKLTSGGIVGLMMYHGMMACTDQQKFNDSKKIFTEAIDILSNKTPDEWATFMLKTATALEAYCFKCHGKSWARTKTKKISQRSRANHSIKNSSK